VSEQKAAPRAKVWQTDTEVQCRNETSFKAKIRFRYIPGKGLVPAIDCPNCGRCYHLQDDGAWFSDRELVILEED